ncbi:hypothetical protein [Nitrosopumilus sp.]|uniref:hypothetical protein n=1 Tax=Nitrosopumilus sp. TaxID=2024843 RepID=UPI00247BEFF7|nr:hypothetical protein [Nitrosopumilus sp.]MCV0431240.1 hypothetical protein [Nitrosopumilus sp.]
MKTRYKIILVIGIFALFYVTVPLFSKHCTEVSEDCTVFWQLMHQTRAGIVTNSLGEGIGEWSGTAQGMETPTVADQLRVNIPFIQTMIIPPLVIISVIVFWDRRKSKLLE